jgi:hypothetical protein
MTAQTYKRLLIVCVLGGLFVGTIGAQTNQKAPVQVHPTEFGNPELRSHQASLQKRRLQTYGASFFDGNLVVGASLGLVNLDANGVSGLLYFHRKPEPVSGPWNDVANHLLWLYDESDGAMLFFDGKIWNRMNPPRPPDGETRGDSLAGIAPAGSARGFWMAWSGLAWKWEPDDRKWVVLAQPSSFTHKYIGILPLGSTPLLIQQSAGLAVELKDPKPESDELINPSDASKPIPRETGNFWTDSWTVADDEGYICTTDHRLVRVTMEHVVDFKAPGPCEALNADPAGHLVVSFKRIGVFRYTHDAGWQLLAKYPNPDPGGDYHVSIASDGSQVIFGTYPIPICIPVGNDGMKCTVNAVGGIWLSRAGALEPVTF